MAREAITRGQASNIARGVWAMVTRTERAVAWYYILRPCGCVYLRTPDREKAAKAATVLEGVDRESLMRIAGKCPKHE